MFKHAQIDETGRCISVSFLASEVDAPHMILLELTDDVQPGDIFDGQTWSRPEPIPEPAPSPTPEQQRIEALEAENITLKLALADLAETQEAEKLATQLALAELAELVAGGE